METASSLARYRGPRKPPEGDPLICLAASLLPLSPAIYLRGDKRKKRKEEKRLGMAVLARDSIDEGSSEKLHRSTMEADRDRFVVGDDEDETGLCLDDLTGGDNHEPHTPASKIAVFDNIHR
jgi:hypothetical protein